MRTITKKQHMLIMMLIGALLGTLLVLVGYRGIELYLILISVNSMISFGLLKYVRREA